MLVFTIILKRGYFFNSLVSYMICATPGSGTTLLCEASRNTGIVSNPDEYFGPMHVKRWTEKWQTSSEKDYLEKAMAHRKGENGVWGVKVMRLYWQNVIQHLQGVISASGMSESELLSTCYPNLHYIWITRRDKVRQAISWIKFIQGSAWYWEDEKPQALEGLEFKPDEIRDFTAQTANHDTAWQEFFGEIDVQPYIAVYEDLVNAYEETAKDILKYLKIPYQENLEFSQRRIKKQADAITDEWVQRYLAMYRDTERL